MTHLSKTRKGYVLEYTDSRNGMLVAGGICGVRYWYSDATVARVGTDPGDLLATAPDRVLHHGTRIR